MRILEDSLVRLLKRRPFYGQFLLQCRRRSLSGSLPAGVTLSDGIPTLAINRESFALFSTAEQQALLEHLTRHLLHLHPCRRRERQSRTWDLACDLAVNQMIENLPRESPLPARFRLPDKLSAEEYYERLPRPALLGNQNGGGAGEAEGPANEFKSPRPLDDHRIWQEADRTPQLLAEQVVRQMVQTALKRCHQEIPGELRPLIDGFLTPAGIPWQQILRQFVGNAGRVSRRTTWLRSHRRFGQDTPGVRKQARLNLLVAVDVSDSTNHQPLREAFAGELLRISRGRESRLTVVYAGSRIQRIETFSSAPQTVEVYAGGGYTDLRPAFDYARRMMPPPAAVIYLTDGFGQAPAEMNFPTLWVLSEDGQKPADWGMELRLKTKENT
jgi:predicted metal-dependent peptidase